VLMLGWLCGLALAGCSDWVFGTGLGENKKDRVGISI